MPPSVLSQLGADGGQASGRKAAQSEPPAAGAAAQLDAAVSPFRELTSVLVDVAFAKVSTWFDLGSHCGSIDQTSLTCRLIWLRSPLRTHACPQYDADRDGRLSLAEFQQFAQHVSSALVGRSFKGGARSGSSARLN